MKKIFFLPCISITPSTKKKRKTGHKNKEKTCSGGVSMQIPGRVLKEEQMIAWLIWTFVLPSDI